MKSDGIARKSDFAIILLPNDAVDVLYYNKNYNNCYNDD